MEGIHYKKGASGVSQLAARGGRRRVNPKLWGTGQGAEGHGTISEGDEKRSSFVGVELRT